MVPIGDMAPFIRSLHRREQARWGHAEAGRFGYSEIDHQLKLRWHIGQAFGEVRHIIASVQPTGNALIDTRREPVDRLFGRGEHDVVLENVVEVDVPATAAVEDRDRPPAVDVTPKLLLRSVLDGMHSSAS